MKRVLVVRPSSLGDVVHALPVVCDIARALPDVRVDWLAEEAFAPLVALHPRIDNVIGVALRRWRRELGTLRAWREMLDFRRRLRDLRYDAVLDLQEQVKGALMARSARGEVHGFDRRSVREPVSVLLHHKHHAIDRSRHFEDKCRALAGEALDYIPHGAPDYGLVPPAPRAGLLPSIRYAVGVHVTSRDDKRWPDAHWHLLIDALDRADIATVLPWGTESERRRSEALAKGHARAIVPQRMPLPEVATLLANAEVVVGVDTGLVHLAAALRAPTVALFTSTDAKLAGVAVAGAHAVDLGGNGTIPGADAVIAAVGPLLRRAATC